MSNMLCNYKIDYNHLLGSGVFGDVYAVTKRPSNEKGCFSYLCPYLYDYIFRPDYKKAVPEPDICVKISKTSLRILFENCSHPLPLRRPVYSFCEPSNERRTNALLQKHGLSKIEFYKTNSIYSQFKTRVNGQTLKYYFDTRKFYLPDNFVLRESFIEFLRKLYKSGLYFEDIHHSNIMFDEQQLSWEIIDGDVSEQEGDTLTGMLLFLVPREIYQVILEQVEIEDEYTPEVDSLLFSKFIS